MSVGYIPGRSPFTNRHIRAPRALRSSRSRCLLPFFPQYQLVIPLGQNCRPIGDSQWLFPPLHAGTLRCHSDALVHRSTGHQASFFPGKLGDLSQIPFFALTLHCCLLVWSKSEGERGLLVFQVLTCRLIDPNTRFWSRMHSHGQLGRPCFQKKTPSPERGGGGERQYPGSGCHLVIVLRRCLFGLSLSTSMRLSGINGSKYPGFM